MIMKIQEKIERYLKTKEDDWQDDDTLDPEDEDDGISTALFERMADLILSLDEDQLSDWQAEQVDNILELLDEEDEDEDEDEDEELTELRLAKRTKSRERMKARQYRRTHKGVIKRKRKRFLRSAAGKRRVRLKKRMAGRKRTATGRRMVRYHR